MSRLLTPPAPFTCVAVAGADRRTRVAAPDRLAALRLCGGTTDADAGPAADVLAGLVRRAAAAVGAPFGVVSRVEVERDRWLATAGLPAPLAAAGENRARPTFCEEVVVTGAALAVDDALANPHFAGFPAVTDHGVRACLAAPLSTTAGHVLGSLCVFDTRPRAWTADDRLALADFAAAAVAALERDAARGALRDMMEGGLDSTYLLTSVRDAGGRIVDFVVADCNARAAVQVGLPSREALVGRAWHATFLTPRARAMAEAYARVAETGEPYETEFAVTDPRMAARGHEWLRVQATRVGDGVAVTSQDITARKAAEAALREGEARYRSLVESLPVVVYRAQPEPPYAPVYVSSGATAYGYTMDDWLAEPDLWVRLLHPEDRARVLAETTAALEGRRPVDYEYRIVASDGAVHWVHDRGDFVFDAEGRAAAWQGIMLDVTDRRRAEAGRAAATAATAEREAHFRALIEHAQDVIGVLAADGTILYESPAITRVLGVRPEDMLGRQSFDFVHRDDRPALAVQFATLLATPGAQVPVRYRCRHAAGGWRALEGEAWNLVDHPAVRGVVVNVRDVTDQERAAAALRESEARLRLALEAANDGIWDWHVPTGRAYYSPRWTGMLGYADGDVAASHEAFLALVHPEDRPHVEAGLAAALAAPAAPSDGTPDFSREYRLRAKAGAWHWVLGRGDVVERDPAGRPLRMAGTHVDVHERKALEAALVRQATHDALTGLANRDHFRARVDAALARSAAAESAAASVVVLFVDLDDFKAVNDSLGHAAGDALLQATAGRLLNATRGCDVVARLGGDEFAVLLDGVACEAESRVVADRIAAALGRPFALAGRQVSTPGSVGIARAEAGDDADALLRNADLAMYRAKAQGKGRVAVFAPAMHAALVDRVALAEDLRRVTDWQCEGAPDFGARDAAGEFRLVYQPVVALAGVAAAGDAAGDGAGRAAGAEALFRWRHPTRGFVSPAECIPLAEETGLVVPIGRWVLETACREAAGWPDGRWVSVNVSAQQLQRPAFVDEVTDVLAATGLAAGRLTLEITEGVLMQRTDETLARLHALKALGVRLAVDDFGTGYSSLAYLQRFPLDVLKLDKAFVDPLARGGTHVALARTVLALGASLGLRCVAEGVETAEQQAALEALGCGWAQGYLFARPLSAEAMRALAGAAEEAPVG